MNQAQANASHQTKMIRIALLALTLVVWGATIGFCSEPNGGEWSSDYDTAVQDSKNTGRPIMLVFTGSDWCMWCQKLDRDILSQPEFSKWSKKLIKIQVDFPQSSSLSKEITDRNQFLLQRYGQHVESYPTILFVNAKGKVLAKTGYINSDVNNWIANADQILPQQSPAAPSNVDVQVVDNGN